MSMEGPPEMPPQEPERIEREPLTDEQCLEAMKTGNFEKVREWYEQEMAKASEDVTTGRGRFDLAVRLAKLQFEAGVIDEETGENYGYETLRGAAFHADNARQGEAVDEVDALIAHYRAQGK